MPEAQITNQLLLIRPTGFAANPETAESNTFQQSAAGRDARSIQDAARAEFEGLLQVLRTAGVDCRAIDDRLDAPAPDAVFPNNWISFHADGTVVIYPMLSPIRRREIRPDLIARLENDLGVAWRRVDLAPLADAGVFLEGTGSLVLDRPNHIAYACRSPRTTAAGLAAFAEQLDYTIVDFDAVDAAGQAIYHTNVMMSVGDGFAIVGFDTIPAADERARLRQSLEDAGHEIVAISMDQIHAFAGNALAVADADGRQLIVMSARAHASLEPSQIETLERHGRIVSAPLPTIEDLGGGSARCMLAEIHAPIS